MEKQEAAKRPRLLIYGAGDVGGQFAYEYKDLGNYSQKYELVGFIDNKKTGKVAGFPILGTSKDFYKMKEQGIENVLVSLLLDPVQRLEKFHELDEMGFGFPSIYNRYFSEESKIGRGVYIHDSAQFIGYKFEIGDFSVISANSVVERTKIGKGVIINPLTFIGYGSTIGDATVIYHHSSVGPGINVGAQCKINPYVFVHKDLPDKTEKKRTDNINGDSTV